MKSSRTHGVPRWALWALAAAFFTGIAAPVSAQWKWIDGQGRTQYSDLPPPRDTPPGKILQRPSTAAGKDQSAVPAAIAGSAASGVGAVAALPARRAAEPELEAKLKQAEQEAAGKKKAEEAKVAAAKAENCARARTYMRTLDSGVRIARSNEKGEREIMDDARRQSEAGRTREVIASDCR